MPLPDDLPAATRTLLAAIRLQLRRTVAFSDVIYWTPNGCKVWRVQWDAAAEREWQRKLNKIQHFYAGYLAVLFKALK